MTIFVQFSGFGSCFFVSNIPLADLLTFGVAGAVFGIAREMCQLPAYFDNLIINIRFENRETLLWIACYLERIV